MKFKKHLAVLLSLALSFAMLTGVYAQEGGTSLSESTQQEISDSATEVSKTEGEWDLLLFYEFCRFDRP